MSSASAARLCLVSPAVTIDLSARFVRALVARFGGLDGVDLDDPIAVARATFARVLPERLVRALEDIERFGTKLGREAIFEAARSRVPDLAAWLEWPEVDLAARVVLRADRRNNDGEVARQIVRRARVRVARYFSPRASYEIVALRPLRGEAALIEAARAIHGHSLDTAWTVTEGNVVYAAALHSGPAEKSVRKGGDGSVIKRVWRPQICDRVRWDLARSRVGFQLARPAHLPPWISAVQRACGDGAPMLALRPAFSLRVPNEKGARWFDPRLLPRAIRGVAVVGCELDDGTRYSARSATALSDLHDRLGTKGGYLVRVTLRFEMTSGERTDATIELPNKLTIADPRFEDDVRAAIDALLLTAPGTLADDLGSLAPFEHAAWRWIEVVTALGFADGVKEKLFTQSARSRRAADEAHRPYGSSLSVHALDGETTQYALAEDLSVHAYDVAPDGAVRWSLDVPRFAASLAARLKLGELRLKRAPPEGLLPIGALALAKTNACIFHLMRVVREDEAGDVRDALRLACGTAPALVLVGKGRTLGKGIAQLEVDAARLFGRAGLEDVLAQIAEALGVEDDEINPSMFGTESAPLVLLKGRGEAWFATVRLRITANQLAMLLGLARTPGEWVSAVELGGRISPNAGIIDQVVRKARVGWEEKLAKSFAAAGVPMPDGLPQRILEVDKARGCYRLGVGVVVR